MNNLQKLEEEWLAASDRAYEARLAHMTASSRMVGSNAAVTIDAAKAANAEMCEADFENAHRKEDEAFERLIAENKKRSGT